MNQAYCPECETEMTKSIVGYLCHGCGAVHGFEKVSTDTLESSGPGSPKKVPASKTSSFARHQPQLHPTDKPKKAQSKITHHVKKFVVPQIAELPKPVDEEHLLATEPKAEPVAPMLPAESAELVTSTQTPAVSKPEPLPTSMPVLEPAPATAAMKEEFSADVASSVMTTKPPEQRRPTSRVKTYIMPVLAGLLVVATLVLGYLVIR
jgi:hypothetical protein